MEGSIAVLPAKQLQGIAVQAARSGVPLTAMRLLKALAVRCARDADALMHVCTALHVQNDFFILYGRLHCCYDIDEFFELFACVQHAYGTRVFRGLTFDNVHNCVCVVTMCRVCVFRVDGRVVSVLRQQVMRDVNVNDFAAHIDVAAHIAHLRALPSPSGELLPALPLQVLPFRGTIPDRAGALQELREVLSPLHPPHNKPLTPNTCTHRNGFRFTRPRGARGLFGPFNASIWAPSIRYNDAVSVAACAH
jgi:hypothetical protein